MEFCIFEGFIISRVLVGITESNLKYLVDNFQLPFTYMKIALFLPSRFSNNSNSLNYSSDDSIHSPNLLVTHF